MDGKSKKPFEDLAAQDKKRYDKEMALYKGKESDPNKPKRPLTAYFIFLHDFRIKMKGHGVDHKEMLKLAGEEWRNMSAEQKKPFEKKSIEAGKKYEQEMAEYRAVSYCFGLQTFSDITSLRQTSLKFPKL